MQAHAPNTDSLSFGAGAAQTGIAWLRFALAWLFTLAVSITMLVLCVCVGPTKAWVIVRTAWGRGALALLGIDLSVNSDFDGERGAVFIANHESLIDVVALPAILPKTTRFVAKRELSWVPLWGWAFAWGGAIMIDRTKGYSAIERIQRGLKRLPAGWSILVFPEGTRSRDGRLHKFKHGAFHLAMQAQLPIVPVAIAGARDLVPPHRSLIRGGPLHIEIGRPIDTRGWQRKDTAHHAHMAFDAVAALKKRAHAALHKTAANTRAIALVVATLLGGVALLPHRAHAQIAPFGAQTDGTTLAARAVKKGDRGVCHTVFEGDDVEPFDFVVKGLMPSFLGPKRDLILVKLVGPKPEHTGVVAGMSGSPCFIAGRLVGALSYAFGNFAKEPIAGITPIALMREVQRMPAEPLPWRQRATLANTQAWHAIVARAHVSGPEGRGSPNPAWAPYAKAQKAEAQLAPIAAPLLTRGIDDAALAAFLPMFAALNVVPQHASAVASGAGAGAPHQANALGQAVKDKALRLVPGGSMAIALISGDADVSVAGTVTTVDGDDILAFGHPFMGAGPMSMPLAQASIVNTMVTYERSFKMAATGPVIGEINQDRTAAVGGRIGRAPNTVDVTGTLHVPGADKHFILHIARDPTMTPQLLALGLTGALHQDARIAQQGTLVCQATIDVDGHLPIVVHHTASSERDSGLAVRTALKVGEVFGQVWNSPFGAPGNVKLDLDVHWRPEISEETIESITLSQAQAKTGDTIDVAVGLRRQDGQLRQQRWRVAVQDAWAQAPGKITWVAAGPSEAHALLHGIEGPDSASTYPQHLEALRRRRSRSGLYLFAIRQGTALTRFGQPAYFLPPSAATILGSGAHKHQGVNTTGVAFEKFFAAPGSILGERKATQKITATDWP